MSDNCFDYGTAEMEYLSGKDPVLGQAIAEIGKIERKIWPDLFEGLLDCIIGQQIVRKGSDTIWSRLRGFAGAETITPLLIQEMDTGTLKKAGISLAKAGCMKKAAYRVLTGELKLEELRQLTDGEIYERLCGIRGIGRWTVDMFLIFSIQRRDIVSWEDMAIRKGIAELYRMTELTRLRFDRIRERYRPYGTIASFYLWEIRRRRKH